MLKEITAVGRQPSDGCDAAVRFLLRAGGMLCEKPGDMMVEDDRLVNKRSQRAREQSAAGAAAADAHFIVNDAVDHGMLAYLQLQRAAVIHRQRHLFFISQLGHRLHDIHAVGAFDLVDAAEDENMGTVLLRGDDADNPAAAANERALIADVGVGVDLHHHRAVGDRGLCNDGDDVKIIALFGDDIGGRFVIGIGSAGSDRGNDRFHDRGLFRSDLGVCRYLQGPYKGKPAVFIAEALARALFTLGNAAFDAAVAAEQGILRYRILRYRAGFAVFDAGDAVDAVVVDYRLSVNDPDRPGGTYLLTRLASHTLADFNSYHFSQLL
ncbi:hypothetical protein SDC9_98497 [bioreactor metagenome]|uniref:Uncharacterized protein n=1 Tax=bioreactor metagenome TaxID=1076179 RepID=A0A645AFM2_9ZZZZ